MFDCPILQSLKKFPEAASVSPVQTPAATISAVLFFSESSIEDMSCFLVLEKREDVAANKSPANCEDTALAALCDAET